jgi:flagellar protein FlaG
MGDTSRPIPMPSASKAQLPDLGEQLASINQLLQERRSNLSFSVDESTGKTVVRIVRQSTGELIRQIPSDEALAIAVSLQRGDSLNSLGIEEWS